MAPDKPGQKFRLRWRDPDLQKVITVTLDALDNKTADTREAARVRKWKEVFLRKEEIAAGAVPHRTADMRLSDVFALYFKRTALSEGTLGLYQSAVKEFLEWCEAEAVTTVRSLTKAQLRNYRVWLLTAKKNSPKKGGKRAERERRGERSTHSINRILRSMSSVLNTLRKDDLIRLSRDEIADGLERFEATVEKGDFLRPAQLKKLLDCCPPDFRELVLFTVLCGARISEVLAITPNMIEGSDIHLPGRVAKTKKPRVIDGDPSPLMQTLYPLLPFSDRWTYDRADSHRKRIQPVEWTWNTLRRTCGTFLVCSPSIYGAGSIWLSCQRLGHTISVAQAHYTGRIKVSPLAKTLEQALELEPIPSDTP